MSSTKINKLHLLQQNLQNIQVQKQQMQEQLTELNSALTELKTTDKAYKIVGKIMLSASRDDLTKDLEEKREVAELRVKSCNQQEENIKKNIEEAQKEVMEELQKK